MHITPEQIRAARALLRMDQEELARLANVSVVTVRRLEARAGGARVHPLTLDGVQKTLEQAGAEFIAQGVRRRRVERLDAQARDEKIREISLRGAAELRGHDSLTQDDLYDENGLPS